MSELVIGCNYHTTWQSNKTMRFVLHKLDGDTATLITRTTNNVIETHVDTLIFIDTPHNHKKAKGIGNQYITIEVSLPPWSESAKSWHLLTEKGMTNGSWSGGKWFPKRSCTLDEEKGTITLPKWLHDKIMK